MTHLTEHFTLEEMIFSDTAIRRNILNNPSEKEIANLKALCENVLEPLRLTLGKPIRINSGYRSPELNLAIGGVPTSQHMLGEAVDTTVVGMSINEYFQAIKDFVALGGIEPDQIIREYSNWVHISYRKGFNRKQFLKIDHGTGYQPA